MPIRLRGKSWQIDVRLADGTRFRRTYPTQAIAAEAEKAMTPNPLQRSMGKFAARTLRNKSSVIGRSGSRSSSVVAPLDPIKSPQPTSSKCVMISSKKQRQ